MGIVNATPDSFSDGEADPRRAIARGRAHLAARADIVDVGGESTRPGATPVPVDEELRRVLPVVRALAESGAVSIDTYKASVAEQAIAAGAKVVNDISGGLLDPALLDIVAASGAIVILGHIRGNPATMTDQSTYVDVISEVRDELGRRIEAARAAGIPDDRIWIDPGLGFAKRADHTLTLLARLDELKGLGHPIVIGASRKSFLSPPQAPVPANARETATAAADAIAIYLGAAVVRVHDVAGQMPAIGVARRLREAKRPTP